MLLTNLSRLDLLRLLPQGGEAAEIGVAEGVFSRHILRDAQPRRLHLIDPWEHQARDDYQTDRYGNVAAQEQESRFQQVSAAFAAETASRQVELIRAYSSDAAPRFSPGQLDWVYLDGLHSEAGVAADLGDYAPKVKPDGFLLGHDYTNHQPARQSGFGVVEAVNAFCEREGWHFLLLTMENFPTYVLVRDRQTVAAQTLVANVLFHGAWTVELGDYPRGWQYQHNAVVVAGKTVVYPTLTPTAART